MQGIINSFMISFTNDKFKEIEFEPLETPKNGTSSNPILNQAAFNLTMLIIGGVIGGKFSLSESGLRMTT